MLEKVHPKAGPHQPGNKGANDKVATDFKEILAGMGKSGADSGDEGGLIIQMIMTAAGAAVMAIIEKAGFKVLSVETVSGKALVQVVATKPPR